MIFWPDIIPVFRAALYMTKKVSMSMDKDRTDEGQSQILYPSKLFYASWLSQWTHVNGLDQTAHTSYG